MKNGNGGPGSSTPDKSPLHSRKFAAFLVAEATWKILAALVLFWGRDSITTQVWVILLSIIIVAGFVEALYIGGQASLDKYIRVAQIVVGGGGSVSMKGVDIKSPLPPKEPPESALGCGTDDQDEVETQKTPDNKPGEPG